MKHSGAGWYMSAYLNNDINAMKTYIQTAKREGQTESQIEEAVKNVVKGDSGLFRKSWKANSETAMDFCDQIVIEVYEDDGVTQKESEKYYFDSVAEMNKKRKKLESDVDENGNKKQAYRNGSSGRHYYSVKAYSYKNGKLTNKYDYSKVENFMNKAQTEGFDMSEEDNWQETATYTNFNPSDKVSYQDKTSYTTTTSITKRGETAKVNKTDAAEDTEQYEDFDVSFDNNSSGGGKGGGGKAKKIAVPDYKDYVSEYRKSSRSASSLLKSMKTYSRDELKNRLNEYASPQKTKDVSGRLNYYLTGEDKPKTFEDQFKKYFGK
jgi:hypothetical protein